MDFSIFAGPSTEVAPRMRRTFADVAVSVIKGGATTGLQLFVMLSPKVAARFGTSARVDVFSGGGVKVTPCEDGYGFRLRRTPKSDARQIRFRAPDFIRSKATRPLPAEYAWDDGALLIALPDEIVTGRRRAPAVESPALAARCADPETTPERAAEVAAAVERARERPSGRGKMNRPAAPEPNVVPVSPAREAAAVAAVARFDVVKLGGEPVRSTDLEWLRRLAAGEAVVFGPYPNVSPVDWSRVREALRDVDVLMPIGGGRLSQQGRALLARLIRAHDLEGAA